ncbi:alcohol dehydrogenase catalytic domain-containing protein, partial [Nocardia seriolae]
MRALVVEKPGQFTVESVPDPTPGVGEVVIRVDAVGICGTDIHTRLSQSCGGLSPGELDFHDF